MEFGIVGGGNKRGVQSADFWIRFEQFGQAVLEHCFSLIFIELGQQLRLRKGDASCEVSGAHQLDRVFLARTRADRDAMEG